MLLIVSLFACVAFAGDSITFLQDKTIQRIDPAPGNGVYYDGGTFVGIPLGSSSEWLMSITGSEAHVRFCAGTPHGCLDGGVCCWADGGTWMPPGEKIIRIKSGGQTVNARSDGGARVIFTPVQINTR